MTQKGNHKMCLLERVIRKAGFRLEHDGSGSARYWQVPPDEMRFFIRRYRLYLDNEPTRTQITFKYDVRSGSKYADFEIHCSDPELKGKEKLILEDSKILYPEPTQKPTKEQDYGQEDRVPSQQVSR